MTSTRARFALDLLTYLVLAAGAVVIMIPLVWMLSTSLKTEAQIFKFPPEWFPDPILWSNYPKSMTGYGLPFVRFFLNSGFVTVLSTVGALLSSSIVAFSFSRLSWKGRDVLFFIVIITMMIPREVIIVPEFIVFKLAGWINTYLPLIVPSFFGHPFYIFILRQYMMGISPEMDQAARIDGCSTWRVYWNIIMPQCRLVILTVIIFSIQAHWNEFLGPLVYLNSTKMFTVSLGLSMFSGQYGTQWGLLMAASLLVMLPILILFAVAQKYFIQGIVITGIK
ncbi:carbohydrate ABC transporter permease [Paenibacillus cremeus]|uniref:Carbohydrate ABC transporter permease n=1 Tax=Paenibacillus cremeus TaxID=2163881 RepID=A0A559K5E9_9BACL|nr:carbohydrate ABC transporter permease [Paenibacillus cremeus]TVY07330.1 carbohydrate ABC transporter permease [Paenibacillus cremeus]